MEKITYDAAVTFISSPILDFYSKIDYGKAMATINEHFIKLSCDDENLLHDETDKDLLKNLNINRSNNGSGFDLYHKIKEIRIQTKFRQVDGCDPTSRQVHFENTRRKSVKNENSGSKTGHVCYSTNEFDYIIITLCHIKDGKRPSYKEWSFSIVNVSEIEDPENKGFCFSNIPSDVLKKNYCKNIEELKERISNI